MCAVFLIGVGLAIAVDQQPNSAAAPATGASAVTDCDQYSKCVQDYDALLDKCMNMKKTDAIQKDACQAAKWDMRVAQMGGDRAEIKFQQTCLTEEAKKLKADTCRVRRSPFDFQLARRRRHARVGD